MNQKFKLYGMAEVLHLNARKEGPDDDKQLAVDVKLRAVTDRAAILFFDDQLAYSLYTDIGAVRNTLIGPIPMKNEIEDYRMECAGSIHYGVRLKKFSLEAMDDNKVAITFQASFKPSGDEVATMAEYLQDEISVSIEPANDELDLVGGGTDKMAELNERLGDLVPDEMYAEAKNVVITNGRASISLVQRELRIGYNRAARLIEQMEADRIVSKPDGAGVRQVLYPKEAA